MSTAPMPLPTLWRFCAYEAIRPPSQAQRFRCELEAFPRDTLPVRAGITPLSAQFAARTWSRAQPAWWRRPGRVYHPLGRCDDGRDLAQARYRLGQALEGGDEPGRLDRAEGDRRTTQVWRGAATARVGLQVAPALFRLLAPPH